MPTIMRLKANNSKTYEEPKTQSINNIKMLMMTRIFLFLSGLLSFSKFSKVSNAPGKQ